MKHITLDKVQSFCVISDVHLRSPDSPLTQKFINTLNSLNNIDAVILLGDIFDFIAAPVPFFLEYWKNVFDACAALKQKGIQVYLTEGNHDFGFEHFDHARFKECFTQCGDFEIIIKHPTHGFILLKHGDEVVCTKSYHPFRNLVKSNWFQQLTTKTIPGSWMQAIFSRYAKLSRKNDKYRSLNIEFMNAEISKYINKHYSECDIFIMGHVHHNIDQVLQLNKPVRVLVGQAWFDQPNILYVSENQICRKLI